MQAQNLQQMLMINSMDVANMKEQLRQHQVVKRWIAAKMVNARKKVMTAKIAAKKKEQQRWTVVKMGNAPKKAMMVKTAVKMSRIINIKLSHKTV